jgi:signal transduction histidine kinase
MTIAADLPVLSADRQRLFQIILNILSNACKFTEEGDIWVTVRNSGQEIVIEVKDTGPGIAPHEQSLVFEAFKQTDAGIQQGNGTGLGMPISKRLAEAHGGRLWFESEAGQGATFFVTLPINGVVPIPIGN